MRTKSTVGPKRGRGNYGTATEAALANLRKLAQSAADRPRVLKQVTALRAKGVTLSDLADCCGVVPSTICSWQKTKKTSKKPSRRHEVERVFQSSEPSQMQIVSVVPPKGGGFWPKLNLRAEWSRIKFSFELI